MADFFDQLNQQLQQRATQGHTFNWDDYSRMEQAQKLANQPKKQQKGNFLTSLIPSGGGIAGAAGGAALGSAILPGAGTLVGALLGGALGGGAGKVAENAVEGQKDLGQGVGQEALLNGVLGAGPLRLIKGGVDVARGVKAGSSLADAVTQAGSKAVNGSIKATVGNKLTKASNDLVVKNFRLTPSQLNNFKNKFGEDASQVIKKYNLVGKDASAISENAIKPLQGEFDSITQNIPALPTSDVLKAFKSKYEPLINSAVEDKQAIGQQLKQQADSLAKKYGAEIPSNELAGVRQEFDSLVNYADKAANPSRYGVNKMSADAIRTALQQTADKAGLKASNGMTFKDVGKELSKLHQLTDNIAKQEQLGRGSNPLGLSTLLGGGVGSIGGAPGAIGGAAMVSALNSGAAKKVAANAVGQLGEKLTEKAATSNPFGVGKIAGRIAPVGLMGGLDQLSSPNQDTATQNPTTSAPNMNDPMNANMSQDYNTSQDMSTPQSPYSQENLLYDMQRDPQNADKYLSYYKSVSSVFDAQQPKLSSATAGAITDMYKGLQTLQDLKGMVTGGDYAGGVVQGNVRNLNPFDNQFKQQQAMVDTARQVVGKALEGGVLRKEDEEKYKKILPTMQDAPDVAASKLDYIQGIISSNLQQYSSLVGGGNSLEDALMGAQGGY